MTAMQSENQESAAALKAGEPQIYSDENFVPSINNPGQGNPTQGVTTQTFDRADNPSTAIEPSAGGRAERLKANDKALVDAVTDKIRGESMSLPPDSPIKTTKSTVPESSSCNSGSDGDSSDKEHSRKRKLSSRSSVATEAAVRLHPKRPKESDVPEREEDIEELSSEPKTVFAGNKMGQVFGFGSFASVKSPFVSGQENSPASPQGTIHSPVEVENLQAQVDGLPPSAALVQAQSITPKTGSSAGFAAFASDSPFKRSSITLSSPSSVITSEQRQSLAGPVRRSKSPVGKHQAFGQYSTGMSRFGNMASRRTTPDEGSEQTLLSSQFEGEETVGFEDMLKAKGEDVHHHTNSKIDIHEIEHNTGEEDDMTVFQTRAKLYTQDETFAYKERGTGLLKVNVRRSDGEGARIVMRAEGVLRLLLNMPLYPGLICELGPDPKFIKVAEITAHERRLHAVKVGSAKVAQELYDHLMDNTPSKSFSVLA